MVNLRGNVETRLRKMKEQDLDGIILAYAGVSRLGFQAEISEIIPLEILLPAVGQGAIAVEIRQEDLATAQILSDINDQDSFLTTMAERAFLAELEGGCQVPIACMATIKDQNILLQGLIASLDGSRVMKKEFVGNSSKAFESGQKLALQMLEEGAGQILQEIKQIGEGR